MLLLINGLVRFSLPSGASSVGFDLDIAPDGKMYFSEATPRHEMEQWPVDSLEGRGNGRIIVHDPRTDRTQTLIRNLKFPNGIRMAHDNRSFLNAETWSCSMSRCWPERPKKVKTEVVIPNLPGHPDNIDRASHGACWRAMVGMRAPTGDLAVAMPGFRKRMARRVAADERLFPDINVGCVVRFDDAGTVLESLWDKKGSTIR